MAHFTSSNVGLSVAMMLTSSTVLSATASSLFISLILKLYSGLQPAYCIGNHGGTFFISSRLPRNYYRTFLCFNLSQLSYLLIDIMVACNHNRVSVRKDGNEHVLAELIQMML